MNFFGSALSDSPRASHFIVTLYGDVAAPRGGTLWMGTLIACCAAHGLSESLVRTAVSRLVESGRLTGERIGRKSYYRLTKEAEAEFAGAAQILYAPVSPPHGFLIALGARETDLPSGWVRTGPEMAIAPDRQGIAHPDCAVLRTENLSSGCDALRRFAGQLWPLTEVANTYNAFLEAFAPVDQAVKAGEGIGGEQAVAIRLRLVDLFRTAALADPNLPPDALPEDWPGSEARQMFVRLYLAVAEAADRHIGQSFYDSDGLLPAETDATALRLARMRREQHA